MDLERAAATRARAATDLIDMSRQCEASPPPGDDP
jgi:hypothetical protein